ncbi:P-loop containing nucleoside triphosphate hydrolase protein [Baffinella frigidus]|nr:P-loop containing nucleoside triphosphate hydrolase protein [Cryptophyta sp. CCMP2293]
MARLALMAALCLNMAGLGTGEAPTLAWKDISLSITQRLPGSRWPECKSSRILNGISGEARKGRLLAIMGPSGAGKTSLLHVLAGVLPSCHGQVPRAPHRRGNPLSLAARLPLAGVPAAWRRERVEDILRQLHLLHCRDTRLGNYKDRGISGGERRRLALACELVGCPTLILADEPTSGLDAFQAERMMTVLGDLARQGHTVVISVHQPSSRMWRAIDDVVLISEEFLLDVISVDQSTKLSEEETSLRVTQLISEWRSGSFAGWRRKRLGWVQALGVLFSRAAKESTRDAFVFSVRMLATVGLAGIFGAVFGKKNTIVDCIGSVMMTSINASMIALVRALLTFVEERPVVTREARFYGPVPYLLSKILAEGPLDAFFSGLFGIIVHRICNMAGDEGTFVLCVMLQALSSAAFGLLIGAVVPSAEAALAAGPPLMLVLTIVGAIGPSGRPVLPFLLQPLREMSMIRWGCEGICVSELTAIHFEGKGWGAAGRGKLFEAQKAGFLKGLGLDGCTVHDAITGQLRLLSSCYAATLLALVASSPRPQPLLPPRPPRTGLVGGHREESIRVPARALGMVDLHV